MGLEPCIWLGITVVLHIRSIRLIISALGSSPKTPFHLKVDDIMAKKETYGVCALCGRENQKLMQSHIIPKLVYSRVKTYQNSRFRNFLDLNQLYQDGEKKPMLCHECEEFFSGFEVKFTNKFLDKYLSSDKKILPSHDEDIHNYILTVAWRMLYDDLFILNSFQDTSMRSTYESLEKRLKKYLNQIRTDDVTIVPQPLNHQHPQCFGEMIAACEEYQNASKPEKLEQIDTHIFSLKDLGYDDKTIELLEPFIWGYSCNSSDQKIYAIYSCYNGLVIVTVFWNNKAILITDSIKDLFNFRKSERKLKSFLVEEINYEIQQIQEHYPDYANFMTQNKEKLQKRYDASKKLR